LYSSFSEGLIDYLTTRIEVMSPVTSYPRLVEGAFLLGKQIDPYVSGYFKLNPVLASMVFPVVLDKAVLYWFLVACDVVATILLTRATGQYFMIAGIAFFLNPYTIISELGLSVESFDMIATSGLVYILSPERKSSRKLLGVSVLLAYLFLAKPVTPLVLIPVTALTLHVRMWKVVGSVTACLGGLFGLGFLITGHSWTFLTSAWWSLVLISQDLEPTMGISWNLFSFVFEESQWLFRVVFLGHLWLTTIPMVWRFQKMHSKDQDEERLFRFAVLMVAAVILYQPYPTGINFSLIRALLLACDDKYHDKLSKFMSSSLIFGQMFMSAVAPLWLERNTGNANVVFYLGVVSTFMGMLAIGQALKATRLADYKAKSKKQE
jgi:phosphatidylinositol glycan class U